MAVPVTFPSGVVKLILWRCVYSIVNTLTDNLPAIVAVQLLVDGHQVDTLAGHVDVRRPLMKDLRWTELPSNP